MVAGMGLMATVVTVGNSMREMLSEETDKPSGAVASLVQVLAGKRPSAADMVATCSLEYPCRETAVDRRDKQVHVGHSRWTASTHRDSSSAATHRAIAKESDGVASAPVAELERIALVSLWALESPPAMAALVVCSAHGALVRSAQAIPSAPTRVASSPLLLLFLQCRVVSFLFSEFERHCGGLQAIQDSRAHPGDIGAPTAFFRLVCGPARSLDSLVPFLNLARKS